MKFLLSVLTISLLAVPAFAKTVEKNAVIASAVTDGMFPISSYEITAQIPCYAQSTKLVKTKTAFGHYTLAVTYSYEQVEGTVYCMSLGVEKFSTTISSELPVKVELVNAEAGVQVQLKD